MKEALLHYAWRMQRFDRTDLFTTCRQPVDILHPGTHNTNAGPDFLNARIRLGETTWAGNIEMHLRSSDWLRHRHQEDPAYQNVILHVVMEEDQLIQRTNGERLACLEMKGRIPRRLLTHYQRLMQQASWVACEPHLPTVGAFTRTLWLERLAAERLEAKAGQMAELLEANKGNWEEAFYQSLAQSFGTKVNRAPFGQLARNTPLLLLQKHRHSLQQSEALLFGQAGLLEGAFEDAYPQKLQQEYRFLKKKYSLHPISGQSWKLMRLRPANFPAIRIAQLAALLFQTASLFSKVMAAQDRREIENLFDVKLSNYWQSHYTFDKASVKSRKALGKMSIHLIIINTIAPFLFLYGARRGDARYQERALRLLESLPAESNAIIKKWQGLDMPTQSAFQAQALLQLKNEYCNRKRCLECAIGNAILQ